MMKFLYPQKGESVFRLIRSLSKNEKAYFKKFATRHLSSRESNYIRLFDAMDGQDVYDKQEIKMLTGRERILHLAEAKYYLHKLLLKSLNDFHSAASVDSKIRENLNSIEVLHQKRLLADAFQLLLKTRRLAGKYERIPALLELHRLERDLIIRLHDLRTIRKFQPGFFRESGELLEKESDLRECISYHDHFAIYMLEFSLEEEGYSEEVKALYKDLAPRMETLYRKKLVLDAKRFLCLAYFQYAMLVKDYSSGYAWTLRYLQELEAQPHRIKNDLHDYLSSLHNHLLCIVMMKKYKLGWPVLQKIHKAASHPAVAQVENIQVQLVHAIHLEIYIYFRTGCFREGVKAMKSYDLERKTDQLGHLMGNLFSISLYSNLAWLYFAVNDFTTALRWVNKILNDRASEHIKEHTHCLLRILNSLIHFELGHYQLVDYITQSASRYLKKRRRLFKSEKMLISFLRRLPDATEKKEKDSLLKELKKRLSELEKEPAEKHILDELQIRCWIDSKLNRTSFAEEAQKRF